MKSIKASVFILVVHLVLGSGCGDSGPEYTMDPDIVMIVIDSIRPDHMSMRGYERETTPVLDSLAATGSTWNRVQAQGSWTLPSTVSILTGLSQRAHGGGYSNGQFRGLDPSLPTIPLLIKRGAGYQTAGFFNLIFLSEDFGFSNGFDHFDCHRPAGEGRYRNARETVGAFLKWYDMNRDPDRPLFAVVHLMDLHLPYSPPPPFDTLWSDPKADPVYNRFWGRGNEPWVYNHGDMDMDSIQLGILTGLYDGELAFVDRQIGRLIEEYGMRHDPGNTVFIVIGSNGEELLDHGGMGHGHSLYQELLDVPLIISGRGIPASENHIVASHIDLLPTVLAIPELEKPIWSEGIDLIHAAGDGSSRYIHSSNLICWDFDMALVRLEDRILLGNPQQTEPRLFDLLNDPDQLNPMTPRRETLEQLYYYWSLEPRGNPEEISVTGVVEKALRNLGYAR